ncbi:methionyl-tRNA formyltransferase [Sphingomonas panacisoli]|uniref:Methionyl-tRNA formyltransferase n=1 Tax=Sphingomonas panacisoli TaxID=1813879 RepID=A0A5B8LJ19_9SPHN|nr:methionyl-tRNA formyltransferase [Sphingomonas panacisoli]QDZ07584.1 methionyl-tRNA formyltransferase [Sphingomonas panacisoli]
MRIVFMGTPDFAVPTLDALVAAGHEVAAAYSQPPRPGGRRGRELTPSPVQARAEALGISVRTPTSLRNAEAQAEFAALDTDIAVVAAYGLILPQAVLDAPKHGCFNVHGSLLPRWRGAAPIQRAILAGDAETGVGIMRMEAGLDTGPVMFEGRTGIDGKTAGELTDELAQMGARLMVEVLGDLAAFPPRPQPDDGVTYAKKIDKAETRLDFTQPAEQVERQVRAFNPPGAYIEVGGERIRVLSATIRHPSESWDLAKQRESLIARDPSFRWGDGIVVGDDLTIACGTGAIRPTLVQRAGRGVMTSDELLRGFSLPPGTQL